MIGFYRLAATRLTCKHVDGSPNMNYTLKEITICSIPVYCTILCTKNNYVYQLNAPQALCGKVVCSGL